MKRIAVMLLVGLCLSPVLVTNSSNVGIVQAESIGIVSEDSNNIEDIILQEFEMIDTFNTLVAQLPMEDEMQWFIEYKALCNQYSGLVGNLVTLYDDFTADEIYLMQRCIETEVYDRDFKSKCNVASVILNRLKSGEFADNPIDVVTAPYQFAYHRTEISPSTVLALEYVYAIEDTAKGAVYFHSNEKTSSWFGAPYLFTDAAGHNFYGGN